MKLTRKKVLTIVIVIVLAVAAIFAISSYNKSKYGYGWPEGGEVGFIPVADGEVYYHFYGKEAKGIPIIFIHGGPGGSDSCFFKQIELAEEHPIVLYNQLGSSGSNFDKSIKTAEDAEKLLTIDHYVNEVQSVVDYFDFDEFMIVGRSWGTMLSVEYVAAKQPEGLKGVVLDGPFLNVDIWCSDAERLIKSLDDGDKYWEIVQKSEASGSFDNEDYQKVNEIYSKNFNSRVEGANDGTPTDGKSRNIEGLSVYNYMWGPSEFSCSGTLRGHDSTQLLSKIKVPVLYICGEYDSGTPEAAKKYMAKTPKAQLQVIPGCAHNASREKPKEFNKILKDFANSLK